MDSRKEIKREGKRNRRREVKRQREEIKIERKGKISLR
jgi:hypothetical protein